MAYQTGTGTLQQMRLNLAAFALANGWSAPSIPGAKNYWRIVASSRDSSLSDISLKNIVFRDSLGVSVGNPDTFLSSSSQVGNTASDGFNSTGWLSNTSGETDWIGGEWTVAVAVEGISVDFTPVGGLVSRNPIDLALEWSDDGVTWNAFTVFDIGGQYGSNPYTYDFDPTLWPLTPGDDLFFNFTILPTIQDTSGDVTAYQEDDSSITIYPNQYFFKMGKSNLASIKDDEKNCWKRLPPDNNVAEWHFYADTTVSNYIHCAWRMTYAGEPRWNHVSMGIGDNKGLSHEGFGYLIHDALFFYKQVSGSSSPRNHQELFDTAPLTPKTGVNGTKATLNGGFFYLLDGLGTAYPFPNDGSWPARGVVHTVGGMRMSPQGAPSENGLGSVTLTDWTATQFSGMDSVAARVPVHPVSGYTTMGTLGIWPSAGPAIDDLVCFIGEIPDMRVCRVDNLSDGGEISQDVLTWQTFPRVRKTDNSERDLPYPTSSGGLGWAYKKVV